MTDRSATASRRFRFFSALAFSAALLFASGCVEYHLGSMLPPDIKTVYIPTCINETSEPLIEVDATRSILAQIQMDGTLRLASEDTADTILDVRLTEFDLDPVGYDSKSSSSTTVNQYRMRITATFVLRRQSDNSVVAENPSVVGWHDFDFTGDLTSSKAVALRPTAEDLGRRIVSAIVQYWP